MRCLEHTRLPGLNSPPSVEPLAAQLVAACFALQARLLASNVDQGFPSARFNMDVDSVIGFVFVQDRNCVLSMLIGSSFRPAD
jgi:hypothetical protein